MYNLDILSVTNLNMFILRSVIAKKTIASLSLHNKP